MSESYSTDEDLEIDRLVDGELPDDRRRALLLRFEREPEGWRRCALAFLEAQSLRDILNPEATSAGLRSPGEPPVVAARRREWNPIVQRVGTAALVLAAFVSGWRVRGERPDLPVVASGTSSPAVSDPPVAPPTTTPATEPGIGDEAPVEPEAASNTLRVAGTIRMQVEQDGRRQDLEIPVIEGTDEQLQQLVAQRSSLSENMRRELQRRGHKIETHRQLLAVNLSDGRQIIVPIDQVQVRTAGRMFQ